MATVATQLLGLDFKLFLVEGKRQICTQVDGDFVLEIPNHLTYRIIQANAMCQSIPVSGLWVYVNCNASEACMPEALQHYKYDNINIINIK